MVPHGRGTLSSPSEPSLQALELRRKQPYRQQTGAHRVVCGERSLGLLSLSVLPKRLPSQKSRSGCRRGFSEPGCAAQDGSRGRQRVGARREIRKAVHYLQTNAERMREAQCPSPESIRRHSCFNHSTGTAGGPFAVFPQQPPSQTHTSSQDDPLCRQWKPIHVLMLSRPTWNSHHRLPKAAVKTFPEETDSPRRLREAIWQNSG